MSYTEIVYFDGRGNAKLAGEIQNSHAGALKIWSILTERYLHSKFSMLSTNLKELWNIPKLPNTSFVDSITMLSTYDWAYVKKDNIPKLLEIFKQFEGETNLKEQARIIEGLIKSRKKVSGIAWNQTSINDNPWLGYRRVYNINMGNKHWEIFDEYSTIKNNYENNNGKRI